MKKVRCALVLLLTALGPLGAQENPAYVSRLAALAGPQSVLLTWKDAEGYPGSQYEVWRSEKEIVRDNLPQAKMIAVVAPGVEAYEDTEITQPSFYLVLLRDASGNRRGYYIPFRNKTTVAVKPENTSIQARVRVGEPTYASPQVVIPFTAFPSDRKLVVLRRAGPITAWVDLEDATVLGNTTGNLSPWKDTPAPGLEFYYAIVDAQAYTDGKAEALGPSNTTTKPAGFPLVTVSQETDLDPSLRPGVPEARLLPLPRLQIDSDPGSGAPLAPPAFEPRGRDQLDPSIDAVLKRWAKGTVPTKELPPDVVLPEERSATQEGAGRYLVQIQKAYLQPRDWKGAQNALETVLKLTLDDRTRARARFYLGLSLARQGNYQPAFLEFLAARDAYPEETTPFLEALFSLLDAVPR